MLRRPLVVANWKMNGTVASAAGLASAVAAHGFSDGVEVVICPPYVHLAAVAERVAGSPVGLGAQDVSRHEAGAHTGEIAGAMLRDAGCRWVIVGHSERRADPGETDETVGAKAEAARAAGLRPITCVGETLAEREAGAAEAVVARQLEALITGSGRGGTQTLAGGAIAYEPVWAIGTGRTAAPAEAQTMHELIRSRVAAASPATARALRILYGGSVSEENAAGLFTMPDVDGALVGGASLDPGRFAAICRAAGRSPRILGE